MSELYTTRWADPAALDYKELMINDLPRIAAYYRLRPTRSCDSSPLVSYLYKYFYMVRYCETGNALLMSYHGDDGSIFGFIPFCPEEELDYYFKLQEAWFNRELGIPLEITSADEEGVKVLQESGALDHYEVIPAEELRDYLYEGDALRTLAGRKYSKKRNHINKFLSAYEGRWEYQTLGYENHEEVAEFLAGWMKQKLSTEQGEGIREDGEHFDPVLELDGEYQGILSLISDPEAYSYMKIGGVRIDGKLAAFSIGVRSESVSMAIIDVEKADSEIDGLYQIINREFLLHEFPDVELVNREDDVGIEGLRQSKLSYYPCGFANKYILKQKDFPPA